MLTPNTNFVKVKCECGNEQITFSHASTSVKCSACGKLLVEPTGGKAKVNATVIKSF